MIIPTHEAIIQFVVESNEIEGIRESPEHPLVADHIKAVKFAVESIQKGILPHPVDIHRILLASEPKKRPGEYRTVNVNIGPNTTPLPSLVPDLMHGLINSVKRGPEREICRDDLEEWIWEGHCEFECIHPFIDGNGRTGRIWMNVIRLLHNLPLLTIQAKHKRRYYDRISAFRWSNPKYRQYSARNQGEDVETLTAK